MKYLKKIIIFAFAFLAFAGWIKVTFAGANTFSGHTSAVTSSYYTNSTIAPFEVTTSLSIAFWINPDSWPASDNSFMVSKFVTGNNDASWQIRYDTQGGGKLVTVSIVDDNGLLADELSFAHTLTTSVWTHFAFTWSGPTKEFKWYFNCVLLSTQTGANTDIIQNSSALVVGGRNASLFYTGLIDELQIYNTVITQGHINTICNPSTAAELNGNEDGKGGTGNARNGLMMYYKWNGDLLDSQTLTTTHNLTAVNSPIYDTRVPFAGASAATTRRTLYYIFE